MFVQIMDDSKMVWTL